MGDLLDNFLKVYQLANFIKHSRLQEERQRIQMEDERAERQRRNLESDFKIRMGMEEIGATEITPGVDQAMTGLTDIMGPPQVPNSRIKTPAGSEYFVPRFEQRQQRLIEQIEAKGQAETGVAIGRAAAVEDIRQKVRAQYAKEPNLHFNTVKQGDDLIIIGADPRTGEERSRQVYKGAGKGAAGNVYLEHFNDGDTRVTRYRDPQTKEVIKEEREPLAQKAAAKAEAPKDLSAGAKSAWEKFETAKAKVAEMPAGPEKDTALRQVTEFRDRIVLVHGKELGKGPSEGGWPDIVAKKRGGTQAVSGQSSSGGGSKVGSIVVTPDGRKIRIKRIDNGQITEYEEVP